jgi:signal transduction histidine kinase
MKLLLADEGTGLDLAIARDLAASLGGSLRLLPGTRGASFELRVPAPRAAGPQIFPDAGSSARTA